MLGSKETFKIKVRSRWTIFENLLTSAVFSSQKFNEFYIQTPQS